MAGTWKHSALRASGRPHLPPAQAIGAPGPANRPHPHPGAPDVCLPKPEDRHSARGPHTLQRRPKILAAADPSRPRKRPRSRESSLNPGGGGEEAGIARVEKPEEPLRRGGSLESPLKRLLRAGKLGRIFGSAVILVSAAGGNSRVGSRGSRRAVGWPGDRLSGVPGPPSGKQLGLPLKIGPKASLNTRKLNVPAEAMERNRRLGFRLGCGGPNEMLVKALWERTALRINVVSRPHWALVSTVWCSRRI